LSDAIRNENGGVARAVGICGDERNGAAAETVRSGENVAIGIENGEFAARIIRRSQNFCLVAGVSHRPQPTLKDLRRGGSQISERVGRGIPESRERLGSLGLAQAHQQVAAGECEQFFGTVEESIGKRLQASDFVARFDLKRGGVDCGELFRDCAYPNGRAVGGEIGAARAGNADLGDAGGGG
jgi:hypothetical protein